MGAACGCTEGLVKSARDVTATTGTSSMGRDQSVTSMNTRKSLAFRNTNVGKHPKELYDIEKDNVGEGAFGAVKIGRNKKTKQVVAIKSVHPKSKKDKENLQNEIELNMDMDHPNIARMYETFQDPQYVYIAMELCAGGEMFDLIIDRQHFGEIDAAILMEQILRAVYYMHTRSIAHRDLKPENFLLTHKDSKDVPLEQNTLKVIDFGIAKRFEKGPTGEGRNTLKTKAGTAYYIAPEIVMGKSGYNEKCDVWSCGVILYILLCGSPPFAGDDDNKIIAAVKKGKLDFSPREFKVVSQQGKNLIQSCCTVDVSKRANAEQALNDSWVSGAKLAGPPMQRKDSAVQSENLIANLKNFSSVNRFKKAAMNIMARHVDEGNLKKLRATFMSLDKNGDGEITLEELKAGCKEAGLNNAQDVVSAFESIDVDNSGSISYSEFLALMIERKEYTRRETCWEAFRVFDEDGNGKISVTEFSKIMKDYNESGEPMTDSQIKSMFREADVDNDGTIDFEEFVAMMKK